LKTKAIGITGFRGFIGGALEAELRLRGIETIRLFRTNSIGQYYKIDQMMQPIYGIDSLEGLDCIVHCGARVHQKKLTFFGAKKKYYEDNVLNTIALAKQAQASGVKRFIFLSTVKVNGERTEINCPFSLKDIPHPRDEYAISKYQAELELIALAKNSDMDVIILRLPLVYGKNAKANFKNLLKLVSKNIPLPFKMVNKNLRSFLHIDNLLDLLMKCILSEVKLNDIFYVSDNDDASIERLIILMNNALGTDSKLFFVPSYIFKILNNVPLINSFTSKLTYSLQVDISETIKKLDWRPVVDLREGLIRSVRR
jgi:nucleoside-diphosphate-sugar epimerase